MLADTITQHRLALRAAAFDPLPDDGKECHLIGWTTKTNVSDTDIRGWKSLPASCNTGILCKHTPALDIDIINVDAADAVEALVRERFNDAGQILVRTGLPPKRLVPFQISFSVTPFAKITAKLIAPDGTIEKLEFLGDGQQFVAFGIHPETKQPYSWRGGEPGQVPRSALPEIDEQSARSLINDAADLLVERFGYRRVEDNKRYRNSVLSIPQGHSPVVVADLTAALWKLDACEWRDHDAWLGLMTACRYEGIRCEDFVKWSISDPDYRDDGEEIRQRWRTLKPGHGGALRAALKAKGIQVGGTHAVEVPLISSAGAGRHHNKSVGDRLIGACVSFKRNPTERSLFSHACLIAEIVHEHGLVPDRHPTAKPYMSLLKGKVMETPLWRALGAAGVERTIERAFRHIEAKWIRRSVEDARISPS
jgi:hypothetical protein